MEDMVGGEAPGQGLVEPGFWRDRRVLVTGHTGFIGGWAVAWLRQMGAIVTGYALPPPTKPSFYEACRIGGRLAEVIDDVRSFDALRKAFAQARPQVVLHLAAQSLVRTGYEAPAATFDVNLLGTVNVLEAARNGPVDAVVLMTSDKVYEIGKAPTAYREDDRLGGSAPYEASKACCELTAHAYARCYFGPAGIGLATVRAGNVIGGGDWARDRLFPDAMRAFAADLPLQLRRPSAVRPWQHVLDAVSGLLVVAETGVRRGQPIGAWNIVPGRDAQTTTRQLAGLAATAWGDGARVVETETAMFPETEFLALDGAKARRQLGWRSAWTLEQTVAHSVEWYRAVLRGEDAWAKTMQHIDAYCAGRRAHVAAVPETEHALHADAPC
ncbi:MAG: CDP-glucose 4,6-dehydratase [Methylobacteriaceae bacterium]|nr:CDP-glucose 4,6-dehydratase [Methylobacteriaceae bacterium]